MAVTDVSLPLAPPATIEFAAWFGAASTSAQFASLLASLTAELTTEGESSPPPADVCVGEQRRTPVRQGEDDGRLDRVSLLPDGLPKRAQPAKAPGRREEASEAPTKPAVTLPVPALETGLPRLPAVLALADIPDRSTGPALDFAHADAPAVSSAPAGLDSQRQPAAPLRAGSDLSLRVAPAGSQPLQGAQLAFAARLIPRAGVASPASAASGATGVKDAQPASQPAPSGATGVRDAQPASQPAPSMPRPPEAPLPNLWPSPPRVQAYERVEATAHAEAPTRAEAPPSGEIAPRTETPRRVEASLRADLPPGPGSEAFKGDDSASKDGKQPPGPDGPRPCGPARRQDIPDDGLRPSPAPAVREASPRARFTQDAGPVREVTQAPMAAAGSAPMASRSEPGPTRPASAEPSANQPSAAQDRPDPARPGSPAREISLRVAEPGGERVEVRVQDQVGDVRVSVHARESGLVNSLRQDLPELVSRLDQRGFTTEISRPPAPGSAAAADVRFWERLSTAHFSDGGAFGSGREGREGEKQHQQHQSRQQRDGTETGFRLTDSSVEGE